ncbi:ABC transporter permease [Lacticaseibacillus paracasei]|uniref:ABC superfamily ATP binding cassette transporter, permease protein n=3 Tax=Lactobacillaceae TaxID=33958 RepID=A0A0R1EWR9_9LACO|nr:MULTISPECIES: ABC transporter permease [Lactobacillaceae]OLS06441.1 ABC transporter permease [Lacticaseibacillus casei]ATO54206.1 ABC transporter permease [Loigolactobacillus coryniformis subsp. coryniformis KCTC 3167 = DSM 20001]KRK13948.1 ABC superfamily ATP binding cassette transporter, permease protein [Loigolactobacillus coryniformis subsp. coryniformis KCTC 3167 = DSM 20001]MCT3351846.1 ABC transporter permease [Lacticaseibacillus paracasei]QVI31715.1 ABC transporter permease [Lactica
MRTMAIVRRVFKQMLRDKRTLALMFLAPLLIMALMYFLFQNNTTQVATLGVHNVDHQVVKAINTKHVDIHHYSSNQAKAMIKQHDLDGYLTQKDGNLTITYSNSNPTNTSLIKASLQSGLVKLKIQTLVTATKAQKKVLQTQKQATVSKLKTALAQAQASGNTAAAAKIQKQLRQATASATAPTNSQSQTTTYTTSSHYIYGSSDSTFFENFLPAFLGFFVFFFVFLISGVSLLNERTTGTLSRLLATPIRRSEIIMGYLIGYGGFAIIQTVLTVVFTITVFKIHLVGSIWLVFLTNLLLALVALTLGIFISTFANSEFQMIQFIPLIVVPQIFFAGLVPVDGMASWLQAIAHIMPLYYGANALTAVVTKGAGLGDIGVNLLILVGFMVVLTMLNIVGMKRYRKV